MLVAATLVLLAFPSPVAAATVTLTPTSGVAGITVNAHGAGYPVNQPISVRWDGALVATGNSGTQRTGFDIPFQVPLGAAPGGHTVTMCVTGSGATGCSPPVATATFTVVLVAVTPAPAPSLPPPPTPLPEATPTPQPTVPMPTFPVGAETPPPEEPPIAVVTPAPTPPNQLSAGPFPDLWIKAIEVTQGIQDLQNRMPLVEDRRTYARVYVGSIGEPSWPNTYGALEARRNGEQIGWIWPENGPISAKLGAGSRIEVDDSLNFRLPVTWLHGEITLTAFVYSNSVATVFDEEPEWLNNLSAVQVAFHPAQPLTVHLAPLHMHRSFHPDDVERTYDSDLDADFAVPGGSETMRIVNGLYRYHPLSDVNVDLFTGPVFPIGHAAGHEFKPSDCETTMVAWNAGNPELTDWEPLMDDPAALDPQPGVGYEADNVTLALLDRRVEILRWYVTDAGGADITASDISGDPPTPLPGTPVFVDGCKPDPSAAHEMNQALSLYRVFYDWDAEEDLFVGMIHPSLPTEFGGGISTSGTDAVSMRMTDSFSNSSPWSHNGAETLAHEAGHAAGLKHVPCKDDDDDGVPDELAGGDIDLSHPGALTFPVCLLADPDPEGYYGFDVYWQLWSLPGPTVIGNDPAHEAPNEAWPWMAYQNPGWPDPYHYCGLLDFYGVPCDPTDLGISWSEPDAPAGGPLTSPPDSTDSGSGVQVNLLGIKGTFDAAEGTGTLEGVFVLTEPTESAMRRYSGQYVVAEVRHRLVVLDADGNELASVPIEQQDTSHGDKTAIDFELLVPAFPNARSYQIISAGRDVARLDVSPNAPIVTWGPITQEPDTFGRIKVKFHWDSSDVDGDPLTHTLLYAPDGEHWQVLATQLNETDFEFLHSALPRGDDPRFQVIAFDGAQGASADTGVGFEIPGLPPQARFSPTKLAGQPVKVVSGFPVDLAADAFDPEDRQLPDGAIAWSSSLDGELGSGSDLTVDDLSAGIHIITALATDSDGMTDSISFELEVDGSTSQPQPDPVVVSAMDAIFAAIAAGEDPAAAYQETAGADLNPWLILGLLLAGGAAIGGGLWWRSRSRHTLE